MLSCNLAGEIHMMIDRYGQGAFLVEAFAFGKIIWVSVMVASPTHSEAVTALQAANILEQLDARLTAAGSSRSRLLSVNIWLADIGDWADVNAVWKIGRAHV